MIAVLRSHIGWECQQEHASDFPLTGDFLAGRLRHKLDAADLRKVESFVGSPQILLDGQMLSARGEQAQRATILVDGFVLRSIMRDNLARILDLED